MNLKKNKPPAEHQEHIIYLLKSFTAIQNLVRLSLKKRPKKGPFIFNVFFTIIQYEKKMLAKKMEILFSYMLLGHTQKSALK